MRLWAESWPGRVLVFGLCIAFGFAIAFSALAALLLIPLMLISIVVLTMVTRGDFDIVQCLMLVAAILLPMNAVRVSTSLSVGDVFVGGSLVLILIIRIQQRLLHLRGMSLLLLGIATFVVGGLLGSFFAASPASSAASVGRFAAATLALPLVFGLWRPEIGQMRTVAWGIVLGTTISATVGILSPRVQGRAQGLTNHPNHLALSCLLALGVAFGLFLSSSPRGRVMAMLGIAVLSVGILVSGSRSALGGEAVVIILMVILTHDKRIVLPSVAAAVLLGTALASGALGKHGSSAIARVLGGGGAQASDTQRAQTIHDAIKIITQHPLTGNGFPPPTQLAPHDIVLQIGAAAGVFGIIGFGFAGWIILRPTWRRFKWGAIRLKGDGDLLLIGTVAAVFGYFGNGIFGDELYDRYIWIVFTLAVALAAELRNLDVGLSSRTKHRREPRDRYDPQFMPRERRRRPGDPSDQAASPALWQ